IRGVLAQRLVRRLCQDCKREASLSPALQQILAEAHGGTSPLESAFEAAGCSACRQTGYRGRTGIHEMLLADEALFEEAGSDLSLTSIRRIAEKRGMTTMLDDCVAKVKAGIVSFDALYEVVGSADVWEQPSPGKQAA